MILKQALRNIRHPKNLVHLVRGFYLSFIEKQYKKHFNEESIDTILYKVSKCPQCYLAGECIGKDDCEGCGCSSKEQFFSNKPCPCGQFK